MEYGHHTPAFSGINPTYNITFFELAPWRPITDKTSIITNVSQGTIDAGRVIAGFFVITTILAMSLCWQLPHPARGTLLPDSRNLRGKAHCVNQLFPVICRKQAVWVFELLNSSFAGFVNCPLEGFHSPAIFIKSFLLKCQFHFLFVELSVNFTTVFFLTTAI